MKRYTVFLAKALITLAVLYLIFLKVDLKSAVMHIKTASFALIFLAVLANCASVIVNSKKWQVLMRSVSVDIDLKPLIYLTFSSLFYSSFLPGGMLTGETIKCYKAARGRANKGRIIISVFIDRLTNFAAYILMGLLFLLIVYKKEMLEYQVLLSFTLLASLVTILAVLIIFSSRLISFFFKIIDKILSKIRQIRLTRLSKLLKENILFFSKEKKTFFVIFVYSIAGYFLNVLIVWLVGIGLGLDINAAHYFWMTSWVTILILLPITVLGLGIREGSFIYFLGLLGVNSELALSLSILVFVANISAALVGGAWEMIIFFKR